MENSEIILAGLSVLGTLIGTFGGILTSTKLSNYRLEQLEQKVDKHNSVVERTFKLEGEIKGIKGDINDLKNDIRDLRD